MKFIRITPVLDRTGLSRSSMYQLITKGLFPKPVPLGGRSVGWVESEILDWLSDRIEERDAGLEVFSLSN